MATDDHEHRETEMQVRRFCSRHQPPGLNASAWRFARWQRAAWRCRVCHEETVTVCRPCQDAVLGLSERSS